MATRRLVEHPISPELTQCLYARLRTDSPLADLSGDELSPPSDSKLVARGIIGSTKICNQGKSITQDIDRSAKVNVSLRVAR